MLSDNVNLFMNRNIDVNNVFLKNYYLDSERKETFSRALTPTLDIGYIPMRSSNISRVRAKIAKAKPSLRSIPSK